MLLNTPELKCGCLCNRICPTTGSGPCLNLADNLDPLTGYWDSAVGSGIVNKVRAGGPSLGPSLVGTAPPSPSAASTTRC